MVGTTGIAARAVPGTGPEGGLASRGRFVYALWYMGLRPFPPCVTPKEQVGLWYDWMYNTLQNSYLSRAGSVPALVLALGLAIACDSDEGPQIPPTPTVSGVSATTVAPGDTVRVTGRDFLAETGRNRVRFNNPYGQAVPFAGNTTRLDVVVPHNAITGPVSVYVEENPTPGIGPEVAVPRGVGDVYVIGSGSFELPVPSPTTRYLIVPHATDATQPYTRIFPYSLSASDAPAGTPVARATGGVTPGPAEAFEAHLREDWARNLPHVPGAKAYADGAARTVAQATRQFYVLDDPEASTIDPSAYTRVTAQKRYEGQWCIIYTDVDTLATGNLTWADIRNLGQSFDATYHPTNRQYFGVESDIDGNGKVIAVISPVINRMTPSGSEFFYGGFFNLVDLFRAGQGVPAGVTNQAEVVYMLASDPSGVWGVSQSRSFIAQENLKTFAHEFEHLISFSQRKFYFGGAYQTTWLEEGMAHMAEDLCGINTSNVVRANSFLADPSAVSLEHAKAPLQQRGAVYLFLRWLADRFGEEILEDIVKSRCSGRGCISGITGEDFYQTVADWLAALYLSGRGINTSAKYNYTSINLSDFDPLPVSPRDADGNPVSGSVVRSSGEYYLFRNLTTSVNLFSLTPVQPGRLRVVIVQTQ